MEKNKAYRIRDYIINNRSDMRARALRGNKGWFIRVMHKGLCVQLSSNGVDVSMISGMYNVPKLSDREEYMNEVKNIFNRFTGFNNVLRW